MYQRGGEHAATARQRTDPIQHDGEISQGSGRGVAPEPTLDLVRSRRIHESTLRRGCDSEPRIQAPTAKKSEDNRKRDTERDSVSRYRAADGHRDQRDNPRP